LDWAALAATVMVGQTISGDSEKPGSKPIAVSEPGEILERAQKNVLSEFLGGMGAPNSEREPSHQRIGELAERVRMDDVATTTVSV